MYDLYEKRKILHWPESISWPPGATVLLLEHSPAEEKINVVCDFNVWFTIKSQVECYETLFCYYFIFSNMDWSRKFFDYKFNS